MKAPKSSFLLFAGHAVLHPHLLQFSRRIYERNIDLKIITNMKAKNFLCTLIMACMVFSHAEATGIWKEDY